MTKSMHIAQGAVSKGFRKSAVFGAVGLDFVEVGLGVVVRPAKILATCQGDGKGPIEVLLSQRRAGTVYPHWWEFPGGKIEAGETAEACVARELHEELGVRIRLLEPLDAIPIITHRYEHALVRLHVRLAALEVRSPEPRNLEVAAHRWVGVGDLDDVKLLPANAPILEAIRRWAASGDPLD